MSLRRNGWITRGAVLVLTASGAWLAGRLAATPGETRAARPPAEVRFTRAEYDSATERVAQRLSPWADQALRAGRPASQSVLLFLVRDQDRRSCEDLARQIRELRRHAPGDLPLVVWTGTADTAAVSAFLRRERIPVEALQGVQIDSMFDAGGRVVTPAALVVAPDGMARGTAHPRRFPGTRPKSFAAELGFYR